MSHKSKTNSLPVIVIIAMCLLLSASFTYLYYIRYYKWRDCFGAELRCYDPVHQQVLTTGGMIWAVPAVLFALVGLGMIILLLKKK